jgi:GntR family transcriptional regulator/MocR family aminotransferase
MQFLISVDRESGKSLQDQLTANIRDLILTRQLLPGAKLPSTRDLRKQLGVSRNTVIYAYDRLIAEGYLHSNERSGIFVIDGIPDQALNISTLAVDTQTRAFSYGSNKIMPTRYRNPLHYQRPRERVEFDFRIGRPAASSFPERLWARLLAEQMAGSSRRMTEYGNPAGLEELRVAIADHLPAARGIDAHPDQIIIVAGCQEGLNVIAKILSPAGSTVYVENPCYKGVPFVFESYGAHIAPIPIDSEGICVSHLAGREAGLVCVTPSHQFPMGVTMSLSRRLELLEWANTVGTYVVEDDYDSDFRYDGSPLTALAGLDKSGSVIYVGTFSKSIGAGLRIGYLVVPEELIGPAREAKALLNSGNPWLEQAVLANFISSGHFRNHLRRIRQTYLKRRNTLLDQLRHHFGDVRIMGEDGGMHLTWVLPDAVSNARALQYECLHLGVGIYSIDDSPALCFDDAPLRERAVFFGYPCMTDAKITSAIERVAIAASRVER